MQIAFLQADRPLTKTFFKDADGHLQKLSYPFVSNFTSYIKEIDSLGKLTDYLIGYGNEGFCMLKGRLLKELQNESRAGSTSNLSKTELLVLDLDDIQGFEDIETFISTVLPEPFHNAPYILQHSASSGFSENGFRTHLFFRLSKPVLPAQLKSWLTHINLTQLEDQLELSANAMAIKWPLDRTICQNDKLIYIAPPICRNGVVDPLAGERIVFVPKDDPDNTIDFDALDIPLAATVEAAVAQKITDLRHAAGMRAKAPRFKTYNDQEVLVNPDVGFVSGEKTSGKFVRLNVNNGDSWGYYYNPRNPRYLYNFKDEPIVVLRDFLPDYWRELQERLRNDNNAVRYMVFRDFVSDTYYNGMYDPVNDRHEFTISNSKDKLRDFLGNHELDLPLHVPDWNFVFRPDIDVVFDEQRQFINKWQPTELMRTATLSENEIPSNIKRVITSVVGNDEVSYDRFLNWLAAIYQHRTKLLTAWVFHGVQGTGKGVLFHNILTPLFGFDHCVSMTVDTLKEKFNSYFENCLIFNLDEARLSGDANTNSNAINKIKNAITEPSLSIRAMNRNTRQVRNFTNFIFTSNEYDAISIDPSDRRFNVAPRQETPLKLSHSDIDAINSELPAFANFLHSYEVDMQLAMTALDNEAKESMREASQDSVQQLFEAVTKGDLEYFVKFIDDGLLSQEHIALWAEYKTIIRKWFAARGQQYVIPTRELMTVYKYLQDPTWRKGVNMFSRMCSHKNVPTNKVSWCAVRKKAIRGYVTTWHVPLQYEDVWAESLEGTKPKVVPIRE